MSRNDPFDFDLEEEAGASASEEEAKLRKLEDDADLEWLIADQRGRRFLRRHLATLGVLHPVFTGEALSMAYREGERNAGLRLLNAVARVSPAAVGLLLTEEHDGRRGNASTE